MNFIFFIIFFSESKSSKFNAIGSQLFLRNTSLLFDRQAFMKMPGEIICIPTLSTYRVFSIKNLRVIYNIEHLITNSEFLQNYQLQISNCYFSNFLRSPISIKSQEECQSMRDVINNDNTNNSADINNVCFQNCAGSEYGGALYISDIYHASINNCRFSSCSSTKSGGALYIKNCTHVEIFESQFEDCNQNDNSKNPGFNIGGGVYLEEIASINLKFLKFDGCKSYSFGGAGLSVYKSKDLSLSNINFSNCDASREYSYGGGCLFLAVKQISFHKLHFNNCSANFGSSIVINSFRTSFNGDSEISDILGEYISGRDYYGIPVLFCFCNFSNFHFINFTNSKNYKELTGIIQFSSVKGTIFGIELHNLTKTDDCFGLLFQVFGDKKFESIEVLELKCVCAFNFIHVGYILGEYPSNMDFNVTVNNLYAQDAFTDYTFEKVEFNTVNNSDCYTITSSIVFTESAFFSESMPFSESEIFTISSTPTFNFTASRNFTESNAFADSAIFSPSEFFSESFTFSNTHHFNSTSVFTRSDSFSFSMNFTPSSNLHPEMTPYNLGLGKRDGIGTTKDLGFVASYVVLAILIVLLVIVITLAICKSRKPEDDVSVHQEMRDEFFFPDFENNEE